MKKLSVFLCALLLCALILPLGVSASSWRIIPNPTIAVPEGAPTVDGNISANEGWSVKGVLDTDTSTGAYLTNPLTGTVDFYFAFSSDGIYFAADYNEVGSAYQVRFYDSEGNTAHASEYIDANAATYKFEEGGFPATTPDGFAVNYYKIDDKTTSAPTGVNPDAVFWNVYTGDTFQYCTGPDEIDGYAGWDGDVIGLSFDLLGEFEAEAFMGNTDYAPMYNFGLFENGSVRVARSRCNEAEITDECKVAGKKTDSGFCFEAMIPWDIVIGDANENGALMGLEKTYTKEEVIASGALHRASVTLQDRFLDPDTEMTDTWGRYITVCEQTADGKPGYLTSADNIASMGLKLSMGAGGAGTDTTGSVTTADTGTSGGTVTTKAASTGSGSGTGSGSASQTFDAGIAVAVGALAASGIGIVFSKRRNKR